MDKNKNTDLDTPMPDIVITEPVASLRAKLKLAVELEELQHAPLRSDPLAEGHPAKGATEPYEKIW